jgi:hypothetical protein
MIVRPEGTGLLLVTQPDHARLAAELVGAWQADGLPDRPTRAATLLATLHHDDGWIEEDRGPRWDPSCRRPYDFITLPHEPRQSVWRRGIPLLAPRSTYAAALVAQHAVTITRTSRIDPAWAAFLAEMERARDQWFTADARQTSAEDAVDPPPGDRLSFLRDYAMLAMGDLLSLIVCNGWTDPYEQDGYHLRLSSPGCLVVSPDPFGGRVVRFSVRARRLAAVEFESEAALVAAWHAAPVVDIAGRAEGGAEDVTR